MLMTTLPDVTSDNSAENPLALQWVGMDEIAVPIQLELRQGALRSIAAKANVYVSLEKPDVKGIHMSRLHNIINQLAEQKLSREGIEQLLEEMIVSQNGIGREARVELSFELLLKKPALLSDKSGFQTYPVTIRAEKGEEHFRCEFEVTIPYSSTCPCSASLARQLYATAIDSQFTEETISKSELLEWVQSIEGSVATPHSQRSYAYVRLLLGARDWPELPELIFQLEDVIGTPVQTAVKRADEQEFARLNATNLMFCEDAARRIKGHLENMNSVENYWFKVEHQESLHAHNAVVVDQKFKADKSDHITVQISS